VRGEQGRWKSEKSPRREPSPLPAGMREFGVLIIRGEGSGVRGSDLCNDEREENVFCLSAPACRQPLTRRYRATLSPNADQRENEKRGGERGECSPPTRSPRTRN